MADFFNALKSTITNSSELKEPVFYKKSDDSKAQLEKLGELYKIAPGKIKPFIEVDMNLLKYGINGEENVIFELKNSHLPIIVLHDLYIEYMGLSAQIDFLIITRKFNLIVECKNLTGNIEVNSNGDFVRTIGYKGRYRKEGIYSPITQNIRHIELIKKVRLLSKGNIITKTLFEKFFDENYKTIIVLANPKTVINMKYAKKDVKTQIIRADQLINYIKKLLKESKNEPSTDKEMYELADCFTCLHKEKKIDYTKKYAVEESAKEETIINQDAQNIEEAPIYKDLKEYRYNTSKAEGIKSYFIYSNAQLEALIAAKPKTLADIKKVSGFGEVKCQKYGEDILKIFGKYYNY